MLHILEENYIFLIPSLGSDETLLVLPLTPTAIHSEKVTGRFFRIASCVPPTSEPIPGHLSTTPSLLETVGSLCFAPCTPRELY